MKRCPQCSRDYADDTLSFCLDDGTPLLDGPASSDGTRTAILPSGPQSGEATTRVFGDSGEGSASARASLADENSIAVLPFSNISADSENDYFCDGLADELLNALSKIKGLKVAARTSSFSFRGSEAKVEEIGKSLDVKSVLEGSVRKAGNRLRVQLQLVDAAKGFQIWSDRYDRDLEDIFAVQDEIALAVVDALKVELMGEERSRILHRNTENAEAYQLYLRGRHQFFKLTPDGFGKSLELFKAAIEIDPEYAAAYAWLGHAYATMVVFGGIPPAIGTPKGLELINRAIDIDEDLPDAQFALGMAKMQNERDWDAAETAFIRTLELNPGYAMARAHYGIMLASFGRREEAIYQAEQAIALDPIGSVTLQDAGMVFWILKDYDRVRKYGSTLRELNDNFPGGYLLEAVADWESGDLESATDKIERASNLGLPYGSTIPALFWGMSGQREKAEEVLDELLNPKPGQYVFSAELAVVYAGLGDLDSTFKYLNKAMEQKETVPFNSLIRQLPGVEGDPRFDDLLRRVGLPVPEDRTED